MIISKRLLHYVNSPYILEKKKKLFLDSVYGVQKDSGTSYTSVIVCYYYYVSEERM